MSAHARRLFFSLNCIGVNARLKIRFNIKGNAMIQAISPLNHFAKTLIKEIVIMKYKTVHTGPNRYDGGAQVGF
jgi:hypothetical protein